MSQRRNPRLERQQSRSRIDSDFHGVLDTQMDLVTGRNLN